MRIINTNTPTRGCANFVLLCDHCGREIGGEPANIEFSHLGEAYCLHKACSNAFRKQNKTGRLYWVDFEGTTLTVKDAGKIHTINISKPD